MSTELEKKIKNFFGIPLTDGDIIRLLQTAISKEKGEPVVIDKEKIEVAVVADDDKRDVVFVYLYGGYFWQVNMQRVVERFSFRSMDERICELHPINNEFYFEFGGSEFAVIIQQVRGNLTAIKQKMLN